MSFYFVLWELSNASLKRKYHFFALHYCNPKEEIFHSFVSFCRREGVGFCLNENLVIKIWLQIWKDTKRKWGREKKRRIIKAPNLHEPPPNGIHINLSTGRWYIVNWNLPNFQAAESNMPTPASQIKKLISQNHRR